ncbi:hypothetical protein M758_4G219300 [Ceratodon purpureus]|nr:hypothetical protein M758_4G219300 [Ceratodon purpureus]
MATGARPMWTPTPSTAAGVGSSAQRPPTALRGASKVGGAASSVTRVSSFKSTTPAFQRQLTAARAANLPDPTPTRFAKGASANLCATRASRIAMRMRPASAKPT